MALYRATESEALKETRSMIADHLLGIRADKRQLARLSDKYRDDKTDYGYMMRQHIAGQRARLGQHEESLHVLADTSNTTRRRIGWRY
jgi:hypothetical protein